MHLCGPADPVTLYAHLQADDDHQPDRHRKPGGREPADQGRGDGRGGKRSEQAKGFKVLPRRWVVERTLDWLNRNRRLAKDFETTITSAETCIMIASVQLMIRRLARA